MREWRDVPLTRQQARKAASHVASRFLKRNQKEWRAYNTSAKLTEWPLKGGRRRVLLVPGSRNEVWGHPDWHTDWGQFVHGADALMRRWHLSAQDVVLRCHPNWGEQIGKVDGRSSEAFYQAWAAERGIHCIESRDSTSTLGLIEQCDAIVVNGGSAALEAGIIGKQVLALGPSIYQDAGFQTDIQSPSALDQAELHAELSEDEQLHRSAQITRLTLRFAFNMIYRAAQFVDQVRCETTTRYRYHEGADPDRLIQLLCTGRLRADDSTRAEDDQGESQILELIQRRQWDQILSAADGSSEPTPTEISLQRRWLFRPIDRLRALKARGDL